MKWLRSSRLSISAALILPLVAVPAFARGFGQKNQHLRAAQRAEERTEARAAQPSPAVRAAPALRPANPGIGPHIEQWMENHKNLSPGDQERALQQLPGFNELPGQTQQRYREQLRTLNNMNPEQRSRILNGVEGLERLSPQQQQQWDHAVQQMHALPPPRRALMITAIRDLRVMPADQRQQVIDSPAFGQQFSPDERQAIRTILTAY
jgi:hypothetical protein